MSKHKNVVANIAIIIGGLGLCGTLCYCLFVGFIGIISEVKVTESFVFWSVIQFICICSISIAEIYAGLRYLKGSSTARSWLILTNILMLIAFPIGTIIGVYSLWAILKEDPDDSRGTAESKSKV